MKLIHLGKTRKVDCVYDCIEIVLSKDLIDFRNSNWALRDYIRACRGEQNEFSSFEDLSLGEKIIVGVTPGGLKAERFDCTGRYNVSGILGGGAGSGKTAEYDSLLVQGVALRGNEGNGSLILIDPKQEWIPVWKAAFNQLGVPFYGFDGTVLDSSEIKWLIEKRGKQVVENVPFKVSAYIGGILFIRVIYETIQVVLKETGCSDILEFNSRNLNYKGITRLPRILTLVDELNTIYSNLSDKVYPKSLYKGLIIARLTRTSGFNWFLGGQDPSKTLIQSDERSNYGYNIFGKMDADRYEYFNVTQNQAVIDYEKRNATSDNPNPILSQGMFYAGRQGKTELVKCLFVPKEERLDALKDLNSSFDGMFELDKLVKLALSEGYFGTLETTLGVPNNIVYATLKHLGVISQQEFNQFSDRLLNKTGSSDVENLDDILSNGYTSIEDEESSDTGSYSSKVNQQSPEAGSYSKSNQQFDFASNARFDNKPFHNNEGYVNQKANDQQEFRGKVEMSSKPFQNYGISFNPIPALNVMRDTSKAILAEITRYFGHLTNVNSISISASGLLIINKIPFRPLLDQEFIDSVPEYIRGAVANGHIADIFFFGHLKKFKNLVLLEVADPLFAEGRMRRELGLANKKPWDSLFNKFKALKKIVIGKQVITDKISAKEYDKRGRGGYTEAAFANLQSYMAKMWNTRPAKIATKALGYSLGAKALLTISVVGGPFGLLFSVLTGAMVVSDVKNRHFNNKSPKRGINMQKHRKP